MEERRKLLRRQSDREVIQELEELRARGAQMLSGDRRHRRRAIRHYCKVHMALKFSYQVGDGEDDSATKIEEHRIKGRILDLSPEGCAIFTAQNMDIGQELRLILSLRDGQRVPAEGIIRWTRVVSRQDGFASGVEFLNLSEEDHQQILDFLNELDETMGM